MKTSFTLRGICIIIAIFFSIINVSAQYDLVVAKDGSGNHTTVQAAIDATPTGRTTPYVIFIKNGKYKEKINIPNTKPFIQIVGESAANVILTFDDFSGKPMPGGGTFGTSNSASFTVRAADFTAINITFENTTGESPQALAIYVDGDRSAFKNCRFLGGQDTIFAGGNGARQYYRNCYIDGTVDFIFGDARAIFDSCVIYGKTRSSAGSSFITAANTKQTEPWGYVFRDSKIPANRGGTVYFFGRPWQNDANTADAAKSYNKTIFLNTTMSSSIQNAGWTTWDAGTDVTKITYAEYRSKKFDSTLVDISQRASWSNQLTATEAATYYNNTNLFGSWDPCAVAAGFCSFSQLPIAVTNFKGVKGSSTSTFNWNISWPIAGVKYEVLRSSNRIAFTKVSEQTSANDSTVNYNYGEAVPPPGQTFYYLIQASKTGYATHVSDTVTISSTPTINVTGSFGNFVQGLGTPSTSQSYVISASSLTNNLIITAPTAYELSLNNTTWNTSATPVVLTQDANGNIPSTTISVRLNGSSAGTYNGYIVHASIGADTAILLVSGTVQTAPLSVSNILEWWPMTANNMDSAAARALGVSTTIPTFNKLFLSNGIAVPVVPAYSSIHGQAFGATANGDGTWTTTSGGPGGNLNRTYYEQFVIKASSTHSLRIDSLILSSSFHNTSSNTKLAVVYSKRGFTTADTVNVTSGVGPDGNSLSPSANGAFTTPVLLTNETGGTTVTYRFAISVDSLRNLASGDSLTVRLYYSCGSGSAGRYAKLKNVIFKGLSTVNPVTGDYRTFQTGVWTDVGTWERYDGTTWVNPAPEYPHFNNTSGTVLQNGHVVTMGSTLTLGFGYIPRRTKINVGGQLVINSGVNLNVGNDGTPAATTTDLQIDGSLTLFGAIFTNGNVAIAVNGSFINSGTGQNLSNGGDTVFVGANGTWQQNTNSSTTPVRFSFQPTSLFRVTGLTTAQTNLFKNNVKYGNIIWNNTGATAYYAIRTTLDSSNVKGSFTVQSTGSTNLTFSNTTDRKFFPGGFYQTGGIVNYRESGNVTDTLDLGGDFSVTGGTFNSNMGAGSSLLVRLNGFNKMISYSQNTATNTNWQVNGSSTLGSNLSLPVTGFGVAVNGTLHLGTNIISGSGDFTSIGSAVVSSASSTGLSGNLINTGTKTLSTSATYIFNGATAQATGILLPAIVGALTINNAADVTLNGSSINVTGALTLSSGKLFLGGNTVTTNSVLSFSSLKYVVTNGIGALKINSIGVGSNVFPVGPSATSYNPVILNNAGGTDNFSVSVKTTFDNPVPDPNKVVNMQWMINEEVAGGSNVTVSLSWTTADQAAGFNPLVSSSIIRFNGTMWESYPATITGAGTTVSPYVATATGITAFSPFTVINDAALPLHLLSLKANYANKVVAVNWITASEFNTRHFEVERSADGINYKAIGKVQATNAAGINQYNFNDALPVNGKNYYRLKMADLNGAFTFSSVVTVQVSAKGSFNIVSNPVKDQLIITHAAATSNANLKVVSVDGKVLISNPIAPGSGRNTLNVSALNTGMYILIFESNGQQIATNFLKQ